MIEWLPAASHYLPHVLVDHADPSPPDRLYTDGGCVRCNPSPWGITWAYLGLRGDRIIASDSGIVKPSDHGETTLENNLAELVAAVHALTICPDGWAGDLYTDSQNTQRRLLKDSAGFKGVPLVVRMEVFKLRERLGPFRVHLLDGHPTRKHLVRGIGKRGNPCSPYNVACDQRCQEIGRL